ncbi:hypothetical protein V8C34DRAFT_42627 [Trichoderma compactum]
MDPESEHAARVAPDGNSILDDILPRWERSMTLNPKDPLEQPDYPKYERLMQHWESFVNSNPPPEVHPYWKEGLAEAKKRFTLGPKPTNEVRKLVNEVTMGTERDLALVKSKCCTAFPSHLILEKDMCKTVPLALARLMGMGPPQDDEFSELRPRPCLLWEDYSAPGVRQQRPNSMTPIYASGLVATIRALDQEDWDSIETMKLRARIWYRMVEASLNTDRYAYWIKTWKEEFPEVADGFREEYALKAAKAEAKTEAIMQAELGYPEYGKGQGEAANGEELDKRCLSCMVPPPLTWYQRGRLEEWSHPM